VRGQHPARGDMERDPLLVLIVGFLLTSVAGGILTFFFQRRAWAHQHDVQQREVIRDQSQKVFEDLSTLLDQRLYRMRLVFAAARRLAPQPGRGVRLDKALDEYRAVLTAWNDNLNRNLALVHTYFGDIAREHLEAFLFEEFRAIGEELDQFVREVSPQDRGTVRVRKIAPRLKGLSDAVYEFDLLLVHAIQRGELGRRAMAEPWPDPAKRDVIRFGDLGPDVRAIQTALASRGAGHLVVDGHFGRDTERAVVAVQERLKITERFVVGPETNAALAATDASTLDLEG
jgi:hypothetical protein